GGCPCHAGGWRPGRRHLDAIPTLRSRRRLEVARTEPDRRIQLRNIPFHPRPIGLDELHLPWQQVSHPQNQPGFAELRLVRREAGLDEKVMVMLVGLYEADLVAPLGLARLDAEQE